MDRILSTLGLALRAGLAKTGEFSVENAVKDRTACLVIVAEDASNNTKKLFHDKCSFYGVTCIEHGNKQSIGAATGNAERACAAVLSQGFADSILKNTDFGRNGEDHGKNQNL